MLKVGDNLTVLDMGDRDWVLGDDGGHKYHLPHQYGSDNPHPLADGISNIIHDIGAEGPDDPYAKTVLPLIERILADDYTGTGLFEAIDKALKLVEPAVAMSDPDADEC